MKNNLHLTSSQPKKKRKKKSRSFFERLFFSMLMLSSLQLITFLGTLYTGGEFSYIKQYAYNILIEKTENRKNYVENTLTSKTPLVYETNVDITEIVTDILEEKNTSLEALSSDKNLSKELLRASTEDLIHLLRRSMANDVFMILDTSSSGNSSSSKTAAIYIRDMDTTSNASSNNKDLLWETGSSEIASDFGITLDSTWSSRMSLTRESDDFTFYYKTLETARENPDIQINSLGYWSSFSRITLSDQPSLKYTLPLISEDGTVYGVMGIGFMEKNILRYMPTNDFLSEKACYILGSDISGSDNFKPELHSGAIFSRVVNQSTVIGHQHRVDDKLYDFNYNSDVDINTIGNIQDMNVYNSDSPFIDEQWALISIADKDEILNIYTKLVKLFFISFIVSTAFSIIFAFMINRHITAPVSKIIKTLNSNKRKDEILSFKSSHITEIDRLAEAITSLQINVKEQASRVSKIISMSDIGIGAFMYDFRTDTVFISESLIKLLEFDSLPAEDTTISFDAFRKFLSIIDKEEEVCSNNIFVQDSYDYEDVVTIELYSARHSKEDEKWFKFSLTRDRTKVLGLVLDETKAILEKMKIEYERDYDVTTGLLNRRAYYQKIESAFRNTSKLKVSAFVMWDLDNLKYVNDTYGHDFGDDYIKTAANIFKLFEDYGGVVARMSGDEFNVFLSGFNSRDEIRKIINTVRGKLNESYCILTDGTHYKIRASGGISWYPFDSTSYEMLIKYADFAMYTIKHSTKGNIAEFDISTYSKDSILITGVEEMNRIIDKQCIKYAFQSIISVKSGKIFGYEALMRPQSELFKSPLEFIRIAKTGAKLYEIERLTWQLALKGFRKLIRNGTVAPDTKIFVNSLSNCIMTEKDMKCIEEENRDILGNIVLEILESEKANDEYVKRKQEYIKRWHALTALDDFGSGYNSEYALITLNPNIIKIDRSIISCCDKDISKYNIISKLVQIAYVKNVLVLAEGVETYDEMKTVIECGVDLLQGYYFSRPSFEPAPLDKKVAAEIRKLSSQYGTNKR